MRFLNTKVPLDPVVSEVQHHSLISLNHTKLQLFEPEVLWEAKKKKHSQTISEIFPPAKGWLFHQKGKQTENTLLGAVF